MAAGLANLKIPGSSPGLGNSFGDLLQLTYLVRRCRWFDILVPVDSHRADCGKTFISAGKGSDHSLVPESTSTQHKTPKLEFSRYSPGGVVGNASEQDPTVGLPPLMFVRYSAFIPGEIQVLPSTEGGMAAGLANLKIPGSSPGLGILFCILFLLLESWSGTIVHDR